MRPAETVEDWMGGVAAEAMTRGKYLLIKGIFTLFIKLSSVSVLAFLRYKVGVRYITLGTVVWAFNLHLLFFFWLGLFHVGSTSMRVLVIFMILFIPIALWRMGEAQWNLLRRHSEPRHGADPGRSYLWLLLYPIVMRLKIAPPRGQRHAWWQLNEWRFQRFIEPIFIYMIGGQFQAQGYIGFGGFIQIAAFCSFIHHQNMENNFNRLKQKMIDSKMISAAANQPMPMQKTQAKKHSVVFEKPMRNKRDFENWRKQQSHKGDETQ